MKNLPLFYYPTTWILVDDDPLVLESLCEVFRKNNHLQMFESSTACLNFLRSYQPPLSKKNFLRSKTEDELYGVLQHAPVDFDVTLLAQLADLPNRHHEITVMIVDYNMPEINGFSLAQESHHLPMYKILLTGEAEPDQAVIGFNQKLIHCFIQKSEQDIAEKLDCYLKQFTLQYFQEQTFPLLLHLEVDAQLPLSDPIFISFFNDYCKRHQIKEYYLIDKQGSFLCIDNNGERSCLLVHTNDSLDDWLELQQENSEFFSTVLKEILNRQKIPFFGVGKEGCDIEQIESLNHFYSPKILEGRKLYFWAKVDNI